MRTRTTILILSGTVALTVLLARAATRQWEYTSIQTIIQVVADGKGGCALAMADTNNIVTVVWLDRKGRSLYQSLPVSGPMLGPIQDCSPKQLTYTIFIGYPMIVQVDKKGHEQPVVSIGGITYGTPLAPNANNRLGDKKGFLVINVDTNTMRETLVRYSFK